MAIKRTIEHDEIREWIEERSGRPGIVVDTTGGESAGSLHVIFDKSDTNYRVVTWPEFFDLFERKGLRFHYDTNKLKKSEFSYGFERRDTDMDSSESDETELS